jgi:hypothetical protein
MRWIWIEWLLINDLALCRRGVMGFLKEEFREGCIVCRPKWIIFKNTISGGF